MTKAFFDKIKEIRIDSWSLSCLMIEDLDTIKALPSDWKWVFRSYITSLEYVGSMESDEGDELYEDWSMSSSSCTGIGT
jgi:hypothetical protein